MRAMRAAVQSPVLPAVIVPGVVSLSLYESIIMNIRSVSVSVALLLSMASMTTVAQAGCLKGAVVGGVAGHVAGKHSVAGAAVGCAVGHHMSKKKAREQAAADARAREQQRQAQAQNAPARR
jgi:hypothetical protein